MFGMSSIIFNFDKKYLNYFSKKFPSGLPFFRCRIAQKQTKSAPFMRSGPLRIKRYYLELT